MSDVQTDRQAAIEQSRKNDASGEQARTRADTSAAPNGPQKRAKAKGRPSRKRGKVTAAKGNGAAAAGPPAEAMPQSEDQAIEHAARLSRVDYAKVRKTWAKHFGFIPVTDFDDSVRQARERAKAKAAAEAEAKKGFRIEEEPEGEGKRTSSQRDRLIEVALTSGITFWHDADGDAFATVEREGRIERYRVRFAAFKRFLRLLYGEAHPNMKATAAAGSPMPGGVSDAAMNEALPTLEAVAQRGGVRTSAVRVCRDDRGTVWIDLGDPTWRLVAVDATGWRIKEAADVPLIRSKGMRALPMPARDPAALAKLRRLLNLNPDPQASKAARSRVDDFFKLIVSFMLCVLWPRGPYPILAVNGEQGSAKTTACRIIRMMTDPNLAPIRHVPRNPDDLFVTAKNSRLLALDNVTRLTPELSDALCGIATGSGKGARQLYTDGEEAILGAYNPIIINGIEELLTRGDLADRALSVMLTAISDDDRRDEAEMEAAIAAAAPGILALLLDAMATAMRNLPTLKLSKLPRMADFTRLACAAAPAFGWTADEMFAAIVKNTEAAAEIVLSADPVATALLDFVYARSPDLAGYVWSGTATELLKCLRHHILDDTAKSNSWPKAAHHLSGRLKRAQPVLRRNGILISMGRDKRSRGISIRRTDVGTKPDSEAQTASPVSPTSSNSVSNGLEMTLGVTPRTNGASSDRDEAVSAVTLDGGPINLGSPVASPKNDRQQIDNTGENRCGNTGDAGDADAPLLTNFLSDDEGVFGDDEGEL